MAFHSSTFAIKKYIQETYPEFIMPIEDIQWLNWKSGAEEPNGRTTICYSFYMIAFYLSKADEDISTKELDFFRDIYDIYTSQNFSETSDSLLQIYKTAVNERPNDFILQVPYAISYLDLYDQKYGTNYGERARVMYFRFANAFIKADGNITADEQKALISFKQLLYPGDPNTLSAVDKGKDEAIKQKQDASIISNQDLSDESNKSSSDNKPDKSKTREPQNKILRSQDEIISELNSLIGLDPVKSDVKQLVNFLTVQQMRQAKGMLSVPVSRHLVFYGNPGTGKTTVARLIAQIYKTLNVISSGHLVETDRSGLVAGYIGQTAIKVQEVITKALGGVLFIDEAYSLTGNQDWDFGKEAIDTLIKSMEDNRDDLIVIVAGYSEKMKKFLLSNPGLKSRFNKYFSFEDYSPSQLVTIFELFSKKAGFHLTAEARDKVLGIFTLLSNVKDETFGNARLARNVFEQTINNQANRIISLMDITEQTLSQIEAVDIPGEVEIHAIKI